MTAAIDPWTNTEQDEAQALPWYADTREASRDMKGQVDELAVVQVAADGPECGCAKLNATKPCGACTDASSST